jgi:DNA-directed RNA polymerase specialized sigma24 family protein
MADLEQNDTDMYLTIIDELKKINARDRALTYYAYGYGYDVDELAEEYNLPPERIEDILTQVMEQIAKR